MSNVIDTNHTHLPTDMCEQVAGSGLTICGHRQDVGVL